MFANFKTLLRMIKPLYVIAAVCLWIFSSCQSADYKYEAVYRNLPFDMPRVEAPRFPDRTVNLKEFNAVGNGKLYVHRLLPMQSMPFPNKGRTSCCSCRCLAYRADRIEK